MNKKLITDLDKAIAALGKGTFRGNMVDLLQRAKVDAEQQHAAKQAAEIATAKQGWEQYRKFHDKLQEVCRKLVVARVPEAQTIYLSRWNVFGDNWNPPVERISADLTYHLYSGPEYEAAEERGDFHSHDGEGSPYIKRTIYLYLDAAWIWSQGWEAEAERERVEEALRRVERDITSWQEAIPQRIQDVEEAETKLAAAITLREKLSTELKATQPEPVQVVLESG